LYESGAEACTARATGCGNVGEYVPLFIKQRAVVPMLSATTKETRAAACMAKKYFACEGVKEATSSKSPSTHGNDHIFPIPEHSEEEQRRLVFVPWRNRRKSKIRQNLKS
jgi:hypothetical protein